MYSNNFTKNFNHEFPLAICWCKSSVNRERDEIIACDEKKVLQFFFNLFLYVYIIVLLPLQTLEMIARV